MANATAEAPVTPAFLAVNADAPLAGYRVQIPSNAATPWFEGSSMRSVRFLVAPAATNVPEGLIVLVFDLETQQLIGGVAHVPVDATVWVTAALTSTERFLPDFSPTYLSLPESYAGKEVGVVVAVHGLQGPVGVVVHGDPEYQHDRDPPSAQAYNSSVVATPFPTGTGSDLQYHLLLNLQLGLTPGPGIVGIEIQAGEVSIEDRLDLPDLRPHASLRDVTFTATTPFGSGWSSNTALHLTADGVSEWSYDVHAGQAHAGGDGYQVGATTYGVIASWLVWGAPIA